MAFNAEKFCVDYHMDMARRGSKHYRTGWVNVQCPFCTGSPGHHGGFNISGGYYNCHRCGNHWIPKVISGLLHISIFQAKTIANKYFTKDQIVEYSKDRKFAERLIFPAGCGAMQDRHRAYLSARNFDAERLESLWNLQGTPAYGPYRSRVIAPIYLDGKLVSYQGRDITNNHPSKYMACAEEAEVWHHKFTVYGIDHCRDIGIGVEGIADVWRLGYGAVCFFGIEFTLPQVLMIKRRFKRFFILFDNEPQAQENADKLGVLLNGFNIDVEILENDMDKDPGDMSQADADALMRELEIAH